MVTNDMAITIEYFSDVLCIWAYGGQIRIDELRYDFPDDVTVHYRFLPIFAAAKHHIDSQWHDRGGMGGFRRHVIGISHNWDHIEVNPSVWKDVIPESSRCAHLYLKAIQVLLRQDVIPDQRDANHNGRNKFEQAVWAFRDAFFRDARNISSRSVQNEIAADLQLPTEAINAIIDSGVADAELHLDDEAKQRYQVPGSPTLVLNSGRQLLYGNIGYRIIDANVRELLHNDIHGEASWC